jgi:AcrR family transcriptional regulator
VPGTIGRAERRARTEAAILAAARESFCVHGYQGTTIRGVAGAAGVDPALVMQYFGSKDRLFAQAAHLTLDLSDALPGPADELGERLLRTMFDQMRDDPEGTLSILRSMLTHPQAADAVRDAFEDGANPVELALDGPDARLRSKLMGTVLIGLLVARYLLRIPPVADAPQDRIVALLAPCLRVLATARDTPDSPAEAAGGAQEPIGTAAVTRS